MREAADALEIDGAALRALMFEFPHSGQRRRRASEPCPLSMREIEALRGLAEGKVYKQIAQELSLSVSTVRTHLHNVYRKIGAVDRAQAVLIARDRGWLWLRLANPGPTRSGSCAGRSPPRGCDRGLRGAPGGPWCACGRSRCSARAAERRRGREPSA